MVQWYIPLPFFFPFVQWSNYRAWEFQRSRVQFHKKPDQIEINSYSIRGRCRLKFCCARTKPVTSTVSRKVVFIMEEEAAAVIASPGNFKVHMHTS